MHNRVHKRLPGGGWRQFDTTDSACRNTHRLQPDGSSACVTDRPCLCSHCNDPAFQQARAMRAAFAQTGAGIMPHEGARLVPRVMDDTVVVAERFAIGMFDHVLEQMVADGTVEAMFRAEAAIGQEIFNRIKAQERPPAPKKKTHLLPPHVSAELLALRKNAGQTTDCPVCMTEMKAETAVMAECGHMFCKECMPRLKSCAVCRAKW